MTALYITILLILFISPKYHGAREIPWESAPTMG